jgi:SAM-dependent methyltransferase
LPDAVARHYSQRDPAVAIIEHLGTQGLDVSRLTQADLALVDEFHIGGTRTTRLLAELAGVAPGQRVLDVGSGVGGPARLLAYEFGARVTGLDLTEVFHRGALHLTSLVGLSEQVDFCLGSATDMPFEAEAFDLVWLQHCNMNIPDKARLVAECHRVLRAGGALALHELFAGPLQPVHFPVPWAGHPAESVLVPPDDARALLGRAGFAETLWRDTSRDALQFFRELRPEATVQAFLPPAVMGQIFANMIRNLEEDRLRVVMGVFQRNR